MSTITDFLIRVAGPDPEDLRDSALERTRYSVMGMSVCVTSMFATGAVPAALALATGRFNPIFLVFGVIWGFFVFNLDRWVISIIDYKSFRPDLSTTPLERVAVWLRKLALLIIRLAIATLIGLSISEPVIMLIYRTEIITQVHKDQAAQRAQAATLVNKDPKYGQELQPYQTALNAAATAKKQAQADVNMANKALDAEEGGTGGTHSVGVGPRSAERRADLNRANAELRDATATFNQAQRAYNKELGTIAAEKAADLASRTKTIDVTPGLLDREQALSELAHQYQSVNDAVRVLRGLILLVDVSPVLLKMASPGSVYEKQLRVQAARKVSVAEQSLPRDVEADLEIGDHSRAGRIAHEKAVADEEYRLAGEQLRHDTTLRIQQLSGGSYPPPGREGQGDPAVPPIWYLPTGPLPPGRQPPAPAPPPSTVRDQQPAVTTPPPPVKDETPPQPAPVREESRLAGYPAGSDWSGQFKRNVLGLPGNGIYQSVGSRWRIGAQIPNADLSLSWRTPYLAEDMLGKYQGVAALKKVHPPDKAHGAVEAQQEVMSLPQEKEISPYVAPVIQSGFDPAFGWFVVTPYYANGTLQRRMDADTPLTLERALVITEQVLQGLRDAFTWQDRLLVHMDIKPPNIAFDDDGNVRIIDWGLAAPLNPDYRLSLNGAPRYTMWYAPPEQVTARPGSVWLSPACDIRAVGAVCYAMITGRPPLYLEAYAASMLDKSGNLRRRSEEEFKTLLGNGYPIGLEQFFAVTPGWDPTALAELSDLVATWLDPQPAIRIAGDGDQPSQQAALDQLRRVIGDLRARHPRLLAMEVGATRIQIPQLRSADIVLTPTDVADYDRRPPAATVARRRAIPSAPRDDRGYGAES